MKGIQEQALRPNSTKYLSTCRALHTCLNSIEIKVRASAREHSTCKQFAWVLRGMLNNFFPPLEMPYKHSQTKFWAWIIRTICNGFPSVANGMFLQALSPWQILFNT